jgi:hypothetical protein
MKNRLFLLLALVLPAIALGQAKNYKLLPDAKFSKYALVSPTDITPEGWLRQFLVYQKTGLTGHIEDAGYPFNTGMWTAKVNDKQEDRFWY